MNAGPVGEGATAGAVLRRPVAPMLAAPVDAVPERPGLIHEPKWDGWRVIAFRGTDGVYLQSRAGRNLTTYFPNPRELHRMGSFRRELLALAPAYDRLRPRLEGW
ncbi:ATP-dependent DNA ligase [Micromonospora globbae]|uniref:ATP-dependent DNA ligase n=1 Tax=Micromonospora globbae TaxID=1894969 RepID=UPI00343EC00C